MASVEFDQPIRTYMYERKKLQKSKYLKRETVYVFLCQKCKVGEVHLRKSCMKRVSGLCRPCADCKSSIIRGKKCRKKPYEALYNNFKKRTIREGKTNEMNYEEFCSFTKIKNCHYCLDNLFWTEFNVTKNGANYNLDRKNNLVGYSTENCVPCCWKCNESKRDNYTYEEWFGMTEYFRKNPLTRVDLNEALAKEGMVFEETMNECANGICGI